ncbi:Glutamate-tRNA ligase [Propionispora sp. 2/2-37]|uniref:glutamate--tRNA ligase n=1 Tax=Propionispora sp. 2/2-37 TaxID=1677858 RepID=UPI0006BB65D6|nr:glutamate--tRNA ligase [Propionispora sp. 2/2-37]CUH97736.1 Glutamate-tRNA ligase [Propionispora sp. 2/2-37]
MTNEQLRVRFAPSPTGPFHIGGARSALFNWLLAKKHSGQMVLRIEDTDLERSRRESEENIKEALKWLGMDWGEGIDVGGPYGPYRQTERLDIYKQYTQKLLDAGLAYFCYCTDEELEAERQEHLAKGQTPLYSGRCRNLTLEDRKRLEAEGRKPTVRFRVPGGKQIVFTDLVRGTVSFESDGVGDYVIVKSDGIPVYNYAVVIDDALMRITHVIRAEEHLSNTPRQILLYEALGFPLPKFGHISLILGKDRTKMSKRHGATSVEQYRKLGYLPEALVNFLALLGWAPAGEQELFTLDELVKEFSMDRVAKNPAVFDVDKLNWINAQYIKKSTPERIAELALPHLAEAGYIKDTGLTPEKRAWIVQFVAAVQDHISYAAQIVDHADIFFNDTVAFENQEAQEMLRDPDVSRVMDVFKEKLAALEELNASAVQGLLKSMVKELKLPGKKVYMPIRIALTGQMHGPELHHFIPVIGRERVLQRITATMAKI